MLTGVKDLDIKILNELEDKDLVSYCQTNKQADNICKDQNFWLNRILIRFPYLSLDILKKYKGDRDWSEYYIKDLRKIIGYCLNKTLRDESKKGRLDHVIIAVNQGANIHAYNDWAVISASINGHIDVVRYLVNEGANIHARDDYAIRLASYNGHLEVVKYLLSYEPRSKYSH